MSRPRYRRIACGAMHEVWRKTIAAETMAENAAVEPRKMSPYSYPLLVELQVLSVINLQKLECRKDTWR